MLLEQISQLLEIVASLQAQLAAMQGGPAANMVSYTKLNRSLSIGSKGADVKVLQQILNDNSKTTIALSGPGSRGNETDYFGNLTAQAVIKFQNLNREEVLAPVGLNSGTGFVGPSTIKAINKIIETKNKGATQQPSENADIGEEPNNNSQSETQNDFVTTSQSTENKESNAGKEIVDEASGFVFVERESPYIPFEEMTPENVLSIIEARKTGPNEVQNYTVGSFSKYEATPGTIIEIEGANLKNTAQIKFGPNKIVTGVSNFDGSVLTFRVPKIPVGYYLVEISQDGQISPRIIDFVVTKNNPETPELYLVSPSIGGIGTEVTVYGKNFTRFGNVVEFGLGMGTYSGLESIDGRSIKIKIDPDVGFIPPSPNGTAEWPIYITVINANGTSVGEGLFTLRL
jgi:peptidoglycan hydrolase-like protein with peptidoglycan-binding domain